MVLIYCVEANEFWLSPLRKMVEKTRHSFYEEGASMVVQFEVIIISSQYISQTVVLDMVEGRLH